MAKDHSTTAWQRAVIAMAGTVIGAVVVAALYWMQEICIPLVVAVLLAFLLTPPVRGLQRRGLGRVPSVITVVALAAIFISGVIWLVTQQVGGLVQQLPAYTSNIKHRIRAIRGLGHESRLAAMIEDLADELNPLLGKTDSVPGEPDSDSIPARSRHERIVLEPQSPIWLSSISRYLTPALRSVGGLAMAVVLVIFMLLGRENLRSRVLRLIGQGRLSSTTKAIDEAGQRISRFLLTQALVNSAYGVVVTAGLFLAGVDYPILWGFLAGCLRYVPYVGAITATALPLIFSLAMFDGWWHAIAVVGVFLPLELVTGNFVEPRLYRESMGVSEVALLTAAAFWAWLWGPIGLVLSAPLTVVMVVLGKYVPSLEFLDVLLGDQPALDQNVILYQRLLARDQDEAAELIFARGQGESPENVYDELLVPLLSSTRRDRERNLLTPGDEAFIHQATHDFLEDLGERKTSSLAADIDRKPVAKKSRLIAVPARDAADRLALGMLQQVLDPEKWDVEIVAVATLASELMERVGQEQQFLICIGSLPPGGLAHTRYVCKRLRSRFPQIRIVVGRWGLKGNVEQNEAQLREAGADYVETTFVGARDRLNTLQLLDPAPVSDTRDTDAGSHRKAGETLAVGV